MGECIDKLLLLKPHSRTARDMIDVETARDIASQILSKCRGISCIKAVNTLLYAALLVAIETGIGLIESMEVVLNRVGRSLEPRVYRQGYKEGEVRGGVLQVREEGSRGVGVEGEEGAADSEGGRGQEVG